MKTFVYPLLALITLPFVAGCGMPDFRIKRKVAANEIIGTWELDPKSSAFATDNDIDRHKADPTKVHAITFVAGGTCQFRSVLQMPTRYVDALGEWEISPTDDDPKGSQIDISLKIEGDARHTFSMGLKEISGELILWQFWGDPDSWKFVEYRRQAEQPALTDRSPDSSLQR